MTSGARLRTGRSALRAFPRPLAALLLAVAICGVAWALVMPPWQGPDEIQHYSYVESIAERGQLPGRDAAGGLGSEVQGNAPRGKTLLQSTAPHGAGPQPHTTSSALLAALQATNADPVTVGLAKPVQTQWAFRAWERSGAKLTAANGGGVFPGSSYPPGYYAAESLAYRVGGGNAIDHLYAARLFSVLWLLLTTAGVWLLAGELTRRHRPSQLVAAAAVGLWPMLTFVSSMVNPDALMYAAWAWAFWAMARVIVRGLTAGRLVALLAFVLVALLAKETSVALVPGALLALAFGFWRLRGEGRRTWGPPALVALVVLAVPVAAWVGLSVADHRPLFPQASAALSGGVGNTREFLSYVWQYYLPRLPGMQPHVLDIPSLSTYPAYNVWVVTTWGAFGWVTLLFPHGFYPVFLALTVLIGVAAVARVARAAWRRRATPGLRSVGLPLGLCFALSALLLVGGLHVAEFKVGGPTNQGRYLFPLASLAGLAVVLALRWVPARARPAATGLVLAAIVAFQIGSLGYVAAHYYA